MSYAQAAARGPKQSPEDSSSRAPAPPEVSHSDESTASLIDVDSPHVSSVPSDFESQEIKTDTQATRLEREEEDEAKAAEQKLAEGKKKAKGKGSKASRKIRENADNPVVIGNAVLIAGLGGALGFGAYRKYAAGQLTWKLAGAWAGVVGLFAAGDFYLSQYV
ncbi:MAG: hypothetical protein M1819_007470 [Sarea resinae]|nr:MAG: hypothetical protein M1819_007470 [Sarea resinae]